MCLICDWARALDNSGLRASRRQVLRGAGAFAATAVAAPALSRAAEATATRTSPPSPTDGEADWLFQNGRIHTVDPAQPTAQAAAVRGDEIVYVGDKAGAAAWRGPKTRVVDLAGRMLMPGFVDAHNHLAMGAVAKLGVNLRGLVGKDRVLDAIRAWIATQALDAPLRGHGWTVGVSFGPDYPRREWLDELTGDRPMYVLNADAHDLWFNTAAMKAAGLDRRSPDPDPGKQYYKRDPDGTPTGAAIESAAALPVCMALGMTSLESIRASQRLTIDRAPSFGMTAYMDAGVLAGPSNGAAEAVWRDLIDRDRRGELPVRIVGTVFTRNAEDDPQAVAAELVDWNAKLRSPHLRISICKMWVDGSSIAGTALLLEPFANQPDFKGSLTLSPSHIKAQIEATHRAGFDMHIHADGDGSVRIVLDALEEVQRRLGPQGRRHAICHLSLTSPDDVKRFQPLGIIANGTPLWATNYDGVYVEQFNTLFGRERVEERALPYGDLVRSGATVTFGADLPGVDVDEIPPLFQLESTVTRQRPGFPGDPALVARQRISVEEAIRAYTINGAWQLRLEDQIGSIEVGKKADLIVLGADLFEVDPHDIHRVPVLLTLMDGEARHDKLRV
ncbi:amidohydrolase [Roseiarcus fermentans]|nr:amidohydrolase [Roseiarcus fermentans]